MDDLKRKFNAKLQEAQEQLDTAQSKCSSLEKAKHRLSGELEDLMIEVERVSDKSYKSANLNHLFYFTCQKCRKNRQLLAKFQCFTVTRAC